MTNSQFTEDAHIDTNGLRMQSALRGMLAGELHSHFVTLNFHKKYSSTEATKRLRLWTLNLISRLFANAQFADTGPSEVLRFTAFPELTWTEDPHFHLLLFVDQSRAEYFGRIAADRWKAIVPSGTANVQLIMPTEEDLERVISYATKKTHLAWSYSNFIKSQLLDLPETCRPSKPSKFQHARRQQQRLPAASSPTT